MYIVLFCANKPLTFLGSLDFSEHFNQMLSKSGGDKICHFKKWWGHVPSVPSVNDTYGHITSLQMWVTDENAAEMSVQCVWLK